MEFINRIIEQKRLKQALAGKSAAFVVVYGRRRCGKSTLIKHVLKGSGLYFVADQTEATYQMHLFASALADIIPHFDKVIYPNWEALLTAMNERLPRKITICMDEFPYLVKSAPELPSILQKMMDNKTALRFNLIICGSSQQLMHGLVLDSSAPLYGRTDEIFKIQPMSPVYLQQMIGCCAIETVPEYSVWGGIPRYWEIRKKEKSFEKAIQQNIFSSFGILYEEPMRLFLDDMRETTQAFTILSLVASGAHRMSEIAAKLGKPATSLSAPLEKLVMLGYLEKEILFGENPKNSKKSLYKIADPFVNFYFHFVVPNRSFIEIGFTKEVMDDFKNKFPLYVSLMWEKLCRNAVPLLKVDGKKFKPAARWWGSPAKNVEMEFDFMAESTDGKYLLVGECKWTDKAVNVESLLAEIEQKAKFLPFAENYKIIPCLFLKNKPKGSTHKNIFTPKDVLIKI